MRQSVVLDIDCVYRPTVGETVVLDIDCVYRPTVDETVVLDIDCVYRPTVGETVVLDTDYVCRPERTDSYNQGHSWCTSSASSPDRIATFSWIGWRE